MRRRAVVLAWLVCGCASSGSGESADSTGAETTMTVGSAATVDDSESASSSESAGATGSASAGDTDSASTDGASGGDTDSESATGTGDAPEVVWPISASPEPDADAIRHPYGPRWIGQYDFHAGVDINVDVGTPVHAIAAGTVVSATPWDGESTSGNTVLVEHAGDRFTAYLHLSELLVEDGQPLEVGEELGRSGDTGASTPHLHLTYMVGLTGSVDERRSRNPLEWLPHTEHTPTAAPDGAGWRITLSAQRMRVGRVELLGGTAPHDASYADIVALGSTLRDEHAQFGVWLDVSEGPDADALFVLTVQPDPEESGLALRVRDFDGDVILESG